MKFPYIKLRDICDSDHLLTGRDMVKNADQICEEGTDDTEKGTRSCESSTVFPSLPVAINWLRENVRKNQSVRFQVLSFETVPGCSSHEFLYYEPKAFARL